MQITTICAPGRHQFPSAGRRSMRVRICAVGVAGATTVPFLINKLLSEEKAGHPAAPRHPALACMPGIAGLAPLCPWSVLDLAA